MVPYGTFGYVLILVFFEPLLHERYRSVLTTLVYFFHEVVEDGLISFMISLRTATLGQVKGVGTALVVRLDPATD